MTFRNIAVAAFFALAACDAGASGTGADVQAVARDVEKKTDFYSLEYSYPAKSAGIEALSALLDEDAAAREAELESMAKETWTMQREMLEDDLAKAVTGEEEQSAREGLASLERYEFPFRPHYLAVAWDVAADLPGWMSLGASVETYSGGAHGNQGFDSILWDKQADKMREVGELFVSDDALRGAIQPEFCDLLDAEREQRRGEPVIRSDDDSFDACIDPLENTVLLESSDGQMFDTVSVLVAPYMAGSYAEGSYVIEVPVSDALRAAVRAEFRELFGP